MAREISLYYHTIPRSDYAGDLSAQDKYIHFDDEKIVMLSLRLLRDTPSEYEIRCASAERDAEGEMIFSAHDIPLFSQEELVKLIKIQAGFPELVATE
jgi:hypothetical protein